MKKIIYIICSLLVFNIVFAEDIIITKETITETNINEIVEVQINIQNSYLSTRTIEISEKLPDNVELIDPLEISETKNYNGIEVNFLKWTIDIGPNEISTINYKIKPIQLGTFTLSPTTIKDSSTNDQFTSNSLSFQVNCVSNSMCGTNENYLTCPTDCPSGSSDGICDNIADGICDPDCESEPDCKKSFNYLWIILISIVLIIVLVLIFKR